MSVGLCMHKMERPTIKVKTKECRSTMLADILLNLLKRTEPPISYYYYSTGLVSAAMSTLVAAIHLFQKT
jgi:hypothetical protein